MKTALRMTGSSLALAVGLNAVSFLTAGLSWRVWTTYREDVRAAEHTVDVQRELWGFWIDFRSTESGQRGFLLTGRVDPYLDRYDAAARNADQRLGNARRLTADNPAQQDRLTEVDRLVASKRSEMRDTILNVRTGRKDEAFRRVDTGEGAGYTARIEALLGECLADEDRLMVVRRDARDRMFGWGAAATAVAALAAVVSVAMVLVYRYDARPPAAVGLPPPGDGPLAHAGLPPAGPPPAAAAPAPVPDEAGLPAPDGHDHGPAGVGRLDGPPQPARHGVGPAAGEPDPDGRRPVPEQVPHEAGAAVRVRGQVGRQ